MEGLSQQEILNLVYFKDPKTTKRLLAELMMSIRLFLIKQGRYNKNFCDELAKEALMRLYAKKEAPLIGSNANYYMTNIAWYIYLDRVTRNREDPMENSRFDQIMSPYDLVEQLEVDERKKILNSLISKLSQRCQELLEKYFIDLAPDQIRNEMNYSNMNVYNKKKSECVKRLKTLGKECPECCEYYDFEKTY